MRPLVVRWLGRVPWDEAAALQERIVAGRRRGDGADALLLVEHPPVVTLGRGSDPAHVLLPERELRRRGIAVFEAGRGGDVTFHGPGQLVGYPVVELPPERRDARAYLRDLEGALIRTAADFGVAAGRIPGLTGVWVGERKLAAIGVRLSTGWIASHGFALNVSVDLSGFDVIVPCGIRGRGVTSLAVETGRDLPLLTVAARAAARVAAALGFVPEASSVPEESLADPWTAGLSSLGAPRRAREGEGG